MFSPDCEKEMSRQRNAVRSLFEPLVRTLANEYGISVPKMEMAVLDSSSSISFYSSHSDWANSVSQPQSSIRNIEGLDDRRELKMAWSSREFNS